ncbi:hypothetical protein [Psittacicella hinzii]|uniref:Uncharacterized protein n=1 Tax=Psittacicella hinzii TaxID=2028575 RepID=A0A3A1YQ21_9GAMM|nr:hypothetical protein [Psittacicella hinzii]RIY38434.1 hypothetical protein CKF58_04235 [Psittacicella hinzii]
MIFLSFSALFSLFISFLLIDPTSVLGVIAVVLLAIPIQVAVWFLSAVIYSYFADQVYGKDKVK